MSGENQKENKRSKMESEYDVKDIIVIDNGADTVKIGISGEDKPRVRQLSQLLSHAISPCRLSSNQLEECQS